MSWVFFCIDDSDMNQSDILYERSIGATQAKDRLYSTIDLLLSIFLFGSFSFFFFFLSLGCILFSTVSLQGTIVESLIRPEQKSAKTKIHVVHNDK